MRKPVLTAMEENQMNKKRVYRSSILALTVVLSGCSNMLLYSEARDKQGHALKEAWQSVDLQSRFGTIKENSKAVLDKELSITERVALQKAQLQLRAAAETQTIEAGFGRGAARRLTQLTGTEPNAAQWVAAKNNEATVEVALRAVEEEFQMLGFELPSCGELTGPNSSQVLAPLRDAAQGVSPRAGWLRGSLTKALQSCRSPQYLATESVSLGGEMGATRTEVRANRKALDDLAAQTRTERNEYTAALKAHEDALKSLREGGDARGRLEKAAKRLQDVIPKLEKAQDLFSKEFVTKKKIESISAFTALLGDRSKDQETLEGSSKAAATLVFFSTWADETQKSLSAAQEPELAPLLLERDLLKVNLDGLSKQADILKFRKENREQKLAVQSRQVSQLVRALPVLRGSTLSNRTADAIFLAGSKGLTQEQNDARDALLTGLGLYADTIGRLDAESRKLDVQHRAARHEEILALAEENVGQWNVVIGGAVGQLVDFGASGVRPEQISALINSLSLLWIGSGVNK